MDGIVFSSCLPRATIGFFTSSSESESDESDDEEDSDSVAGCGAVTGTTLRTTGMASSSLELSDEDEDDSLDEASLLLRFLLRFRWAGGLVAAAGGIQLKNELEGLTDLEIVNVWKIFPHMTGTTRSAIRSHSIWALVLETLLLLRLVL